MSLILEALRRSEAERRRGEAPDVLAPVEVARPAAEPRLQAPLRWGAVALAVLAVGGFAWWQRTPAASVAASAGDASQTAFVPSEQTASNPHEDALGAPRARPAPIRATVAIPPPSSTSSATTPAIEAAAPSAPAAARELAAAPPAAALAIPASPPASIASAPAQPDPVESAPPPAPPHSTEFISPESTVRLAELSSEERKQLPALKVSMHMWAPEPANRFVIIDGTRLAEGDRVADATVSAILADGVTLAWRGRQIRLPIR
jgi:general secretion pathway protein B